MDRLHHPPATNISYLPFTIQQPPAREGGECDSNPEDVDDLRPVDVVSSVPVSTAPPHPYLAPPRNLSPAPWCSDTPSGGKLPEMQRDGKC